MAGILQIYGQSAQHYPVYMVGTSDSLAKLASALEEASKDKGFASTKASRFLSSDGEAYDVVVLSLPEGSTYWDVLASQYFDQVDTLSGTHPSRIVAEVARLEAAIDELNKDKKEVQTQARVEVPLEPGLLFFDSLIEFHQRELSFDPKNVASLQAIEAILRIKKLLQEEEC